MTINYKLTLHLVQKSFAISNLQVNSANRNNSFAPFESFQPDDVEISQSDGFEQSHFTYLSYVGV